MMNLALTAMPFDSTSEKNFKNDTKRDFFHMPLRKTKIARSSIKNH